MNNTLEQYQFSLNRLLKRIEQELSKINDDALTYYFGQVKQYVITSLGGRNVARGFESLTFLKRLKGDTIMKEIVLDESILDLDPWLPQEAIDEVIQAIINYEQRQGNET